MDIDIFFFIGGIILCFIVINLLLYFYHKNRDAVFFRHIKNRHYTLIEKVETNIESYSKISAKLTYFKADIVFLDQEIFIIPFNKPILQLSKSNEKFPSIFERFEVSFRKVHHNFLEITGNTSLGHFKITLNFKNKNFDLHSVV
ncbi:hypothetical protein [Chryseobacterium vrystaatense]|uniref:Uncharacterized protein n=1 Tax=Chryseobacterium vrystaatense TaxID=307480 RepID=A0ABR4UM95_9FLAO|nr:hypothetical protein [Chryseobacterium vrystaatense]KFF25938.1 hypothetical protein IW16_13835 [Chryseobacterium vrystaatense]